MNNLRPHVGLLAWLAVIFAFGSVWIVAQIPDFTVALLCLCGGSFPLLLLAITALMIRYRHALSSSWGWLGVVALVLMVNTVKGEFMNPDSGEWVLVGALLIIATIYLLAGSSALFLFRRDVGLEVLAWGMLLGVWTLFFWWRAHPNFMADLMLSMTGATTTTLGALDTLSCFLWCVFPLCAATFLYHTLRLVAEELR